MVNLIGVILLVVLLGSVVLWALNKVTIIPPEVKNIINIAGIAGMLIFVIVVVAHFLGIHTPVAR